jgi:hypothetical protein
MAREIVSQYVGDPNARHLVLVTRRKWGYELRNAIREVAPEVNAQTVFSEDILEVMETPGGSTCTDVDSSMTFLGQPYQIL